MKKTFDENTLAEICQKLEKSDSSLIVSNSPSHHPVHVVYGGADLFNAGTVEKLGKIALKSLDNYAENFVEFAEAMWLKGAETLPKYREQIEDLEFELSDNPEKVKAENLPAWFAWTIYQKTIEKLKCEPVEDFRIDFEDGYGIRSDDEEDKHAILSSDELAKALFHNALPKFIGFRIKSFALETRKRAVRTLDLFLTNLIEKTSGKLPQNFVVTLPKITRCEEVKVLAELLSEFERRYDLIENSISIEIIIETPRAIVNEKGKIALRGLVEAGNGRVNSAHFGAYDYTASFGISGIHQHLQHEACVLARQMMQIALSPLGVRLSDSVTTEMPMPIHRGESLTESQIEENKRAVRNAWRKHFNNVTSSLINGFYQSWDLHPAQFVARYAAIYAFFLESKDEQGKRLRAFLDEATRALMTGNQFDDAASAQGLLNFFIRASNCGALSKSEILSETGLSLEELHSASFAKILENRKKSKTA